jgi:hypothetical protein
MKTNKFKKECNDIDEIAFEKVASQRHINFDDLRELAYIIYDSPLEKKMRKKNRNKQRIKKQKKLLNPLQKVRN